MHVQKSLRSQRSTTDGRVARGNRTRRAIVKAHAALLRQGNMNPSARAIAEKADVSVRTVWSSLGDKESLFAASAEYWMERDARLRVVIDPRLSFEDRLTLYCENRAKRLDALAPAARATYLNAWKSEGLVRIRAQFESAHRSELLEVFAAELPAGETSRVTLDAAGSVASWALWSHLRFDLERSREQAAAVVRELLRATLTPAPPSPPTDLE